MKLIRMQATFGCLDNQVLELQSGLNLLTLPNETGKSTWSAFLLAMLYGVDTGERASKTSLPVKTRYRPWSGKPMSGRIDLIHQGRAITLERDTASARAPMARFRAYDTQSGQSLDWLQGDTCGQTLLGVERSVFERSAFFRQSGLGLSPDAALEQRLHRLVTTGDEDVSYLETEQALRAMRNRCQHNKTGLLPQVEQQLSETAAARRSQLQIHQEADRMRARRVTVLKELEELNQAAQALQAAQDREKLAKKERAQAQWEQAQARAKTAGDTAASLPEPPVLHRLLERLERLEGSWHTLALEEATILPEATLPPCPPAFSGLTAEECRGRAREDRTRLDDLQTPEPPRSPLPLIFIVLLLAGAAAGWLLHWVVSVCLLLAAGFFAAGYLLTQKRRRREADRRAQEAADILARYAPEPDPAAAAETYAAALEQAEALRQQQTADRQRLESQRQSLAGEQAGLFSAVQAFAPEANTPASCRAALNRALDLRREADAAFREARLAKEQLDAVCALVGDLYLDPGAPAAPCPYTPQELSNRQGLLTGELRQLEAQLAQSEGRMLSLGDPAGLAAAQEELERQAERIRFRIGALDLAMETLKEANDRLQSRFSPQLSRLAGAFMARLTGGRYDTVLLDQQLEIDARPSGEALSRPLRTLSGGTADQLYFAVRVAVCQLLLPPDAPMILDDALVYFDDDRLKQALDLLRQEAEHRQILLFTCQDRERRLLAESSRS